MIANSDRRDLLMAGCALALASALPARAQTKPTLRLAAVFSDKDIRADMVRMLAKDVEADFTIEPFFGGTLFKQGTELVALQRDNLEIGNVAPQDISKQMPAWSVLTSAYTFRDANHVLAFFASPLGAQMKKEAEDQLKIKILGPTFFGTRQVGLKPKKKITTPADMAGIKLRMPPGDAWQLLGRSIGANPTPLAFAETYTGAADRRLSTARTTRCPTCRRSSSTKVMSQIVLTSHLIAFDVLCMNLKTWNSDGRRQAEGVPGRRRQGGGLEHRRAPEARGRAGQLLQAAGPRRLRAGHRRISHPRAEGLPRLR
jgi:TRAP-type C4-dicarboxylate transport system substrate-binding protein